MGLVDGGVAGRAIDFAGRGVDKATRFEVARGGENVEGAADVGLHIGVGGFVGVGNANEGSEVEYGVAPGHRGLDGAEVADVAAVKFDLGGERGIFQTPAATMRGVANEGANGSTEGDEAFDEVAANEAPGTGDEDFFAGEKGIVHRWV